MPPLKNNFILNPPFVWNDNCTYYDIIYDCDIYYLHIWVTKTRESEQEPFKYVFALNKVLDSFGNVVRYPPRLVKEWVLAPELIKFPKKYWLWRKEIYDTNIPRQDIENNKELFEKNPKLKE